MTSFAGIEYPKTLALFRKPLSERLKEFKQYHKLYPICGPYTQDNPCANSTGHSCYLASDFAPELRWKWCDETEAYLIKHTGWYTDEYGDSDTIRGIVFRLNHGRGFIAGWSMGEGMATSIEYHIYADEVRAAHAADRLAELAAKKEREYQAEQNELNESN